MKEILTKRLANLLSVKSLVTIALTIYTIVKSKRLSDFLDVLSDERLTLRQKAGAWWKDARDPHRSRN